MLAILAKRIQSRIFYEERFVWKSSSPNDTSHATSDESTRVWFTIHWTRRYYSGVSHEDIENSPQRRFTITSSKKRWSHRIKTSWIYRLHFLLSFFTHRKFQSSCYKETIHLLAIWAFNASMSLIHSSLINHNYVMAKQTNWILRGNDRRNRWFCLIVHLRRVYYVEMKQLRSFDMSIIVQSSNCASQVSNCLRTAHYADVLKPFNVAKRKLFNLTNALNFRPDTKKSQS